MSDKAWGGRFEQELDAIAARFSASVDVDGRLWPQDIAGSKAHVRMLAARGILSKDDADLIVAGLDRIGKAIADGEFDFVLSLVVLQHIPPAPARRYLDELVRG